MDDLDELPPPTRKRRPCKNLDCRRNATRGRVCGACAVAAWRSRQPEIAAERERARVFSAAQQLLRNARAYVATYVRRGKLKRGCCEVCQDPDTVPAWDDPRVPLLVRWFCRVHRDERTSSARAYAAATAALQAEFAAVRVALGELPEEVVARLHAAGLQGFAGRGAEPGSMWYWWALRRAYLTFYSLPASQHTRYF